MSRAVRKGGTYPHAASQVVSHRERLLGIVAEQYSAGIGLFQRECHMTRFVSAAVATIACLACPAAALDLGNGFSIIGEVELEYTKGETNSASIINTDITLRWRSEGSAAISFGFDAAIESLYVYEDSEDNTLFWGGVVMTTGFGDLTVGAARPVAETVYDFPDFGSASVNRFLLFPATRTGITFFATIADEQVAGVSLVGASGNLGYGISLHELSTAGNEVRSSQLALTFQAGNTMVMGGFETLAVSGSATDATTYRVGVLHDFGTLELGAEYAALEASTGSTQRVTRLHAAYEVFQDVTLRADLGKFNGSGTSENLWALGAEYRFGNGGFVQGGATSVGDEETWDVGLGFRF